MRAQNHREGNLNARSEGEITDTNAINQSLNEEIEIPASFCPTCTGFAPALSGFWKIRR
jgi:hypothetical protein